MSHKIGLIVFVRRHLIERIIDLANIHPWRRDPGQAPACRFPRTEPKRHAKATCRGLMCGSRCLNMPVGLMPLQFAGHEPLPCWVCEDMARLHHRAGLTPSKGWRLAGMIGTAIEDGAYLERPANILTIYHTCRDIITGKK